MPSKEVILDITACIIMPIMGGVAIFGTNGGVNGAIVGGALGAIFGICFCCFAFK